MNRRRHRKGQSLLEVTIGIIMMIPVVLCLIDLSVILLGVQTNDANCRNAARAAACGNPDEANFRAQTVMHSSNATANPPLISASTLTGPVQVRVTARPQKEQDLATGEEFTPGGPVTGLATATTSVKIRPFLVHLIYGGKTPLCFSVSHTFPITYVAPASPIRAHTPY